MKTLLFPLLFWLTTPVPTGTASYTYKTSMFTHEQTATLYFSEEAYKYVYQQIEGPSATIGTGMYADKIYSDPEGHVFYRNHATDESRERFFVLSEAYLLEDEIKHDWSLQTDTKTVAGFTCHKATTTFRGRNYTAWFAPEIPINAGPWKFYGLPGLIMEVKDDRGQVSFVLNNLKFPDPAVAAVPAFDHSGQKTDYPGLRERQATATERRKKSQEAKAAQMMAENPTITARVIYPVRLNYMELFPFEKKR